MEKSLPKYGILVKTRPGSMWGATESWCKGDDEKPLAFSTMEEAQAAAEKFNAGLSPVNCFHQYFAAPMGQEQSDSPRRGMRMF